MNIVFNTNYSNSPSSIFYTQGLGSIDEITFNDRANYHKYDVALFMTYNDDLEDIVVAKKENPKIKIGVLDPRGRKQIEPFLSYIDFFIVDSLEMKDFFSQYNRPICLYAEYPYFEGKIKKHVAKDKVVIGYHGNKVHLAGMYPHVTRAIELLGEEHDLEFWMVYNIKELVKLNFGLPINVKLRHIQWYETVYDEELSKVDIGIVPGLMPIRNIDKIRRKAGVCKYMFLDSEDDYIIKFKMPSNPGRIIVFARLGIPVVADFYPSALQLIQDGQTGLLACSAGGWFCALEKLIKDCDLRQRLSDNLQSLVNERFDYKVQNQNLLGFLKNIIAETNASEIIIENPGITLGDKLRFQKESMCSGFTGKIKRLKKLFERSR